MPFKNIDISTFPTVFIVLSDIKLDLPITSIIFLLRISRH